MSSTPSRPETRSAVEAAGLVRTFNGGSVRAVDDVSFRIRQGEVVALLGHNGAGKTTVIDMLLGLLTPTEGEISVFGRSPREAVRAGEVGAILQTGGLLPDVTVAEAVRLMAATHRNPRDVGEVLREARLERIAHRRISRCSGGEQQRVKFAIALLGNPRLIVFDEPTAGMDPEARHYFWRDVQARAAAGTTVLFSTHYLPEAERYASRILVMDRGRLRAEGTVAETIARLRGAVIHADLDPRFHAGVAALDQVTAIETRPDGHSVSVRCADSDAVARYLLSHTPASNLRISAPSLEDAFNLMVSNSEGDPR